MNLALVCSGSHPRDSGHGSSNENHLVDQPKVLLREFGRHRTKRTHFCRDPIEPTDERAADPVAATPAGLSQASPSSRRTRRIAGHASAPNRWGASSSPPTWYGRLELGGVSPGSTMRWPALGSSMTTVTRPERARRAAMFLAAWLLGHTLSSPPATRTSSPRNFSTGMVAASTASLPARDPVGDVHRGDRHACR